MSGAKRSADDAESVVTPANFTAVVGGDEKRARPSIDTQIEDELPSDERDWGDEAVEAALAFDIDESSEVQEPNMAESTTSPEPLGGNSDTTPVKRQEDNDNKPTVSYAIDTTPTPSLLTKVPLLKSPVSLMRTPPGTPYPRGRSGGLIPTPGTAARRPPNAYPHPPTDVPIPTPVHCTLDDLFSSGKLHAGDLDLRILNTLARLPLTHGMRAMEQFSAALHEGVSIRNLNGFLAGIMRRYQSTSMHPAMAHQTQVISQLPPPLQQRVDMMYATGRIKPGDLDNKILLQITEFGDAWAWDILSRFEECDLSKVRAPTAFLIGILKHVREEVRTGNQPRQHNQPQNAPVGGNLAAHGHPQAAPMAALHGYGASNRQPLQQEYQRHYHQQYHQQQQQSLQHTPPLQVPQPGPQQRLQPIPLSQPLLPIPTPPIQAQLTPAAHAVPTQAVHSLPTQAVPEQPSQQQYPQYPQTAPAEIMTHEQYKQHAYEQQYLQHAQAQPVAPSSHVPQPHQPPLQVQSVTVAQTPEALYQQQVQAYQAYQAAQQQYQTVPQQQAYTPAPTYDVAGIYHNATTASVTSQTLQPTYSAPGYSTGYGSAT